MEKNMVKYDVCAGWTVYAEMRKPSNIDGLPARRLNPKKTGVSLHTHEDGRIRLYKNKKLVFESFGR